jgi:hypothetical protein
VTASGKRPHLIAPIAKDRGAVENAKAPELSNLLKECAVRAHLAIREPGLFSFVP